MSHIMGTITETALRIKLSQPVVEKYEAHAKANGYSLEKEIEIRLGLLQDVDSSKPMVINDQQRQRLERVLGKNFSDPELLVKHVERTMQIQAGGVDIQLPLPLLDRLHSRCIGMPFEKFIKQIIVRTLEEYAGMR